MTKVSISLAALLCLALASAAQAQAIPGEVNFRYSEQISNGPAGTCGCFPMQGAAGDVYWQIKELAPHHRADLGLAVDLGVEHTGNENSSGYGLTLTTLTAGPRFEIPVRKVHTFAEALVGFGHGSGSEFPEHGKLVPSASSFAFDVAGGADYPVNKRLSIRMLQLEYLRLSMPNNSTDWQNNLRLGAGITLHFAH